MATKKVAVPPTSTDLAARMEAARKAGGGIQPGAHADLVGPIGNPLTQIRQAAEWVIQRFTKRPVGGRRVR